MPLHRLEGCVCGEMKECLTSSDGRWMFNLPDDPRRLQERCFLVWPRCDCKDSAQNDSPEGSTVRALDVSDQLPDIAVKAHVLRALELLERIDEPRDDGLEDGGNHLTLRITR